MQLELHLFDEVGEIGVRGAGFDVEGPLMSVVGVYGGGAGVGVEGFRDGAEDCYEDRVLAESDGIAIFGKKVGRRRRTEWPVYGDTL